MFSKSSIWELSFVHYITKFTISMFVWVYKTQCCNTREGVSLKIVKIHNSLPCQEIIFWLGQCPRCDISEHNRWSEFYVNICFLKLNEVKHYFKFRSKKKSGYKFFLKTKSLWALNFNQFGFQIWGHLSDSKL